MRYECTKKVMEALTDMVCSSKISVEERLKAAKIVDQMSDSIIKAFLSQELRGSNEKIGNKLINQLDQLNDKGEV